jgi:hypothetical protein
MQQVSRPNCVAWFPVDLPPAQRRLHRRFTVPGRKVSQQMIDSFVKNLGGTAVHNLQIAYSDCANVHIASIINANARDVYADHSLGRNLTDADVANDQWLKERGGNLKSFLRGCNLR